MAPRILLFGLMIAGLTSCATYRTGQTPDDVYYSPAKEGASYVQVDRDEDDRLTYNERNLEDRRLRQQIRDSRFRSFDDDIYWNSPRYNSWGWNTWNNPYNTWGWNNNYGMNYGWGWNQGYNNYWGHNNYYNSNYICIPGGNNLIIISGPGAPKNSSGIRYSSPIQRFVNSGTNYNTGKNSGGSSSRYFGTTNSNNGTRRTGFFGGGNTNSGNWNQGNSSSGNRTFGNSSNSSSNSGGSSRTFSNSGGSSSSGNSGGTKTSSGRRN